ncbi:uncharacterized protein LOC26529113 [Drosophila willistoni]|uniref:uncharacterized protein LOC26529113 n=1 Tax=Drosophila willistoni TaxID=7260 RepID=UPI001F07AA23|nr:uncharacterized protein LOC26529113 [Drosophila willistoni]
MCKTTPRQDAFIVGYLATIFSGIAIGWNAVELSEKHELLLVLEIVAWVITIAGALFLHVGVIKETKIPIIIWIVVAFICGIFLLIVRGIHLSYKWNKASAVYITFQILENLILIILTVVYVACPYLYVMELNEIEQ